MKSVNCSVISNFLQPCGLYFARLLCPWNSLGKNPGVGRHSLLQEIFLTQGSNPGLLHCRLILYCMSHQRSPVEIVCIINFPLSGITSNNSIKLYLCYSSMSYSCLLLPISIQFIASYLPVLFLLIPYLVYKFLTNTTLISLQVLVAKKSCSSSTPQKAFVLEDLVCTIH